MASSSRLPGYSSSSKNLFAVVPSLSALPLDPLHPVLSSLLSAVNLKKDSIKIVAFSDGGIVVHPEDIGNHALEEQESWTTVTGFMQIVSTQAKTVKQVAVKFVARQSLRFQRGQQRAEEDEVAKYEVVLDDVEIKKGVNTLEFCIAFPHSIPVREDAAFASVNHYLVGTVIGGIPSLFGAKDLVGETRVFLTAAPSPSSDMEVLRLNHHAERFTDQLGPISLDAFSSRFTISAPLAISLTLHSPPPNLRVHAIKCYIDQRIDMTSFRDPMKKETVRRPKAVVIEQGWKGPFTKIETAPIPLLDASVGAAEGETRSWKFDQTGQVPNGDHLRASTHFNTSSSIRARSELVLDLVFSLTPLDVSDPPETALVANLMEQSVFIAGCGCIVGRILLPDYSFNSEKFVPLPLGTKKPCKCDEPFEKLLLEEAEYRRFDQSEPAPTTSDERGATGRKIGEDY